MKRLNMNNKLAILLITIGAIGASIGVAQTHPQIEGWEHTFQVNLPITIFFLAVLLFGIAIKRRAVRTMAKDSQKYAGNRQILHDALSNVVEQINNLQNHHHEMSLDALHESLDRTLSGSLADFIENRQSLIDAFGMSGYAHVMTSFAQAERRLNRVWSASADGYPDESIACIQKALPALKETQETLRQQENQYI